MLTGTTYSSIKETATVASRASCDLIADRRLCLTGTPVQNKLDDVFALIKFLRVEPLDDKAVWTEYIGTPVKFGQSLGITRLQTVMKCLTLRRTKESKSEDGKKILTLPPRRDELRYLRFDSSEQKIYDQVFQESKDEFNELTKQNEVMKNYVGILQKILRLRQICDHWQLVAGSDGRILGTGLENAIKAIERDGLTADLANSVYALLREGGSAQCVACGYDLGAHFDNQQTAAGDLGADASLSTTPAPKKTKKSKACTGTPTSGTGTRQNSPGAQGPRALMTKCQHLYCLTCFEKAHAAQAQPPQPVYLDGVTPFEVEASTKSCSACQTALVPCQDVMEVDLMYCWIKPQLNTSGTKSKRVRGEVNPLTYNPSTKIRALLHDLLESSKLNPYSSNFDPEIMMVDSNGNTSDDCITKTVVL
jgi:SWI/SNF-related matrix-associated actin-dependent regulator of chromatin subfamily A3